jgi:hypothetical protein
MKIQVFGILRSVDWQIVTDISGAPVASIFRVQQSEMEAARPSETTVTIYQLTQHNIPEDFFMHLLKMLGISLNFVAYKTK